MDNRKGVKPPIFKKGRYYFWCDRCSLRSDNSNRANRVSIAAIFSPKRWGNLKRNLHQQSAECDHQDRCNYCEWVVRPQRATLLLHEAEAKYCFQDYSPRYVFTIEEIGMDENQFSLVCAIKIAQFMGCDRINFVSCDAHANGDTGNIVPLFDKAYYDWIYAEQRRILPKYLKGVDYEWVTPSG